MSGNYSSESQDCLYVDRSPTFYKISSWEQGLEFWRNEGFGFRPWIPYGQVLSLDGQSVTYPDQYDDHIDPIGMEDDVTGELDPILKDIPEKFRKLATPFRSNQWVALDAMRHNEEFASFIEMELRGIGPSFIVSCWELANIRKRSLSERCDLNHRIMTINRKKLVSSLTDMRCGNIFFRATSRLGTDSIQREALMDLLACTEQPRKAQAIAMASHLFPSLTKSVLQLSDWLTFPAVVEALGEMGDDLRDISSVFPPRILSAPEEYRNQIAQSVRNVKGIDQLESRIANWSQRIFLDTDFPTPPIPGNRFLTPIRNGEELRIEGQEMSHCVAGYAEDVAEGLSYFYRWLGTERATVQLAKNRSGRWSIEENLGKRNARLSKKTVQEITFAVAEQMKGGLFLDTIYVAGTQYYQASEAVDEMQDDKNRSAVLKREPENQYDPTAIEVFTVLGTKLGYIPRRHNRQVAQLIDSGFNVSGQISRFSANSHSAEIHVELFLAGKQSKTEDQEFLDFSYEEPPTNENQVISMIGGFDAEIDHSQQEMILKFG